MADSSPTTTREGAAQVQPGVALSVPPLLNFHIIGSSPKENPFLCYSTSEAIRPHPASPPNQRVTVRVFNLGDMESSLVLVHLVAWYRRGSDGSLIATVSSGADPAQISRRPPLADPVFIDIDTSLADPVPVEDHRLTHIYAVVEDPIFDPVRVGSPPYALLQAARAGVAKLVDLRQSRQLACRTVPERCLRLSPPNRIENLGAEFLEIRFDYAGSGIGDDGPDAALRVHAGASTPEEEVTPAFVFQPGRRWVTKRLSPGDLVLCVQQHGMGDDRHILTTDSGRSTLRIGDHNEKMTATGDGNTLAWSMEDGGGGSTDDYNFTVFVR